MKAMRRYIFKGNEVLNNSNASPIPSAVETVNRSCVVSSGDFRYVAFSARYTGEGRFATWNWQLTLSPAYNRISRNA